MLIDEIRKANIKAMKERDQHRAPFFEISPMVSDFFTEIDAPVTTFLPPVFGNPSWCTASTQQPKLTKKAVHDLAVFWAKQKRERTSLT